MKYDKYNFSRSNFFIFLSFTCGFNTIIHKIRPEIMMIIISKLLTINEDVSSPMSFAL